MVEVPMNDKSEALRMSLALAGITLDEPRPTAKVDPARARAAIDREAIRQILVDARAPAHDIEWMTAACPSVAAARAYRPTDWVEPAPAPIPELEDANAE